MDLPYPRDLMYPICSAYISLIQTGLLISLTKLRKKLTEKYDKLFKKSLYVYMIFLLNGTIVN